MCIYVYVWFLMANRFTLQSCMQLSGNIVENTTFLRRSTSFTGNFSNSYVLMQSLIKAAQSEFMRLR